MICFIKRCALESDPRMQKYVTACKESKIDYFLLTWDRLCDVKSNDPNEICYRKYAPFGNGLKNLVGLLGWILFVELHLLLKITKYKIIHASNFDSYMLAYPFKIFGKKVIFDVYDSSSFKSEKKKAAKADLLILPHERRLDKMGLTPNEVKNLLIIENAPVFKNSVEGKKSDNLSEKIHLSYVGTFESNIRGLENVLDIVLRDERFIFEIAGSGGLEPMVNKYVSKCERIKYHGKVAYSEALKIMRGSDFIVALYYLMAPAHKWACPNKICESLFLGVPVITSKGTLVGADVESGNTGYTVEDNKDSFLAIFDDFGSADFTIDYLNKVANCRKQWEDRYKNYYVDNLLGKYISQLKYLAG